MSDEYDFRMLVAAEDCEGYYRTRWDKATPLTVRAETRDAAFEKAWAVMGACQRGRRWVARMESIEAAPSTEPVGGGDSHDQQ